jgi:hypothetical protein
MDKFLVTTKTLKDRKVELTQLKAIRDQLMIKGLQFYALVDDKAFVSELLSNELTGQEQLHEFMAQEKIGVADAAAMNKFNILSQDKIAAAAQEKLSMLNPETLREIIKSHDMSFIGINGNDAIEQARVNPGAAYQVRYDRVNLQLAIVDKSDLGRLSATEKSAVYAPMSRYLDVVILTSQGVNFFYSNANLAGQFMASPTGLSLSNAQLNDLITAQSGIGSITAYCSYFVSFVDLVGFADIGI